MFRPELACWPFSILHQLLCDNSTETQGPQRVYRERATLVDLYSRLWVCHAWWWSSYSRVMTPNEWLAFSSPFYISGKRKSFCLFMPRCADWMEKKSARTFVLCSGCVSHCICKTHPVLCQSAVDLWFFLPSRNVDFSVLASCLSVSMFSHPVLCQSASSS